ncbi:MAG: septum formation initiator family protein [Pseudomonadota bacterium]
MAFIGKKTIAVLLVVLGVFLGLLLVYGDQGLMWLGDLRQERDQLKVMNDELREENRRLLLQIEKLRTDRKHIEDEARKKLGLIKPNETIYRLKEEPDLPPPAAGGQTK